MKSPWDMVQAHHIPVSIESLTVRSLMHQRQNLDGLVFLAAGIKMLENSYLDIISVIHFDLMIKVLVSSL
jgi:hypothetical protein